MKNIFKYVFIFIISLISGCDILEDERSSISPLDSKINFKIIESYDNYEAVSVPQVFVELETVKEYGCYNFSIRTSHKIQNRVIQIDIIGIYEPGICLTAIGPAKARIKLGEISGGYEFKFNYRNFSDKYNLLISDSLIILDGKETANTKPLINFAYRYPKNSFVYLCRSTLPDTSFCSSFIDTLMKVVSIDEFQFLNFAEMPYTYSSQDYNNTNIRFFYYQNESDFEKIREVLKNYKHNYFPTDNSIEFRLINWMNKKIYSWLL